MLTARIANGFDLSFAPGLHRRVANAAQPVPSTGTDDFARADRVGSDLSRRTCRVYR